jgi:uncharacterized SAM-binding protein YcdF (DUF218 family)
MNPSACLSFLRSANGAVISSATGWVAARGLALALGGWLIASVGFRLIQGWDFGLWLVDLRVLPSGLALGLSAMGGFSLVLWALRPAMSPGRRFGTVAVAGILAALAVANALGVWLLLANGVIRTPIPVPLSVGVALAFAAVAFHAWRLEPAGPNRARRPWGSVVAVLAVAVAVSLVLPVLQQLALGWTDYRRPADLIVVPGARVHADGRLSMAVADRVRKAAELYRAGWAPRVLMSGGPGDGAIHETEAMRREAIRLGVAAGDIEVDRQGWNSAATVVNSLSGQSRGPAPARLLVVSEFYHLPRLKLAYQRAGVAVVTVPADPGHWARNWPVRSMLREIPAFWSYVAKPTSAFHPVAQAGPIPH